MNDMKSFLFFQFDEWIAILMSVFTITAFFIIWFST